jgi:putative MATE family efflux protein
MTQRFDPITGKVMPVFFHYAIPSVVGMLAATSAGIIDGIFIGNYVGAPALAAVNIALPVFYLFAAVVFMLAVGGSVMCGKFLGEKNQLAAREIFTRTLIASLLIALLIVGTSLLFLDQVISMLGANQDLHGMVRDYMQIILWASPLLIVGLTLDYFVRVDGRPLLASFALVAFAVSNIAMDWLFVVQWGWGIRGAAWATALADVAILLILATHWLTTRCNLDFVHVAMRWRNGWDSVFTAAYNGFSEFANEMSLALTTLLFNWIMITRLGVEGVAAFTIIGYLLMIGIEVSYGIGESLQPIVSKNLGARQPKRIVGFVTVALFTTLTVGIGVSMLFIYHPQFLISIFLNEGESATEAIALAFIAVFWPAFLFHGANIALASYFTALHKPLQSAAIAISRSLVLPVIGLLSLPIWFGDTGIFIAIPIAEALTLVFALSLAALNRPSTIVAELDSGQPVTHQA